MLLSLTGAKIMRIVAIIEIGIGTLSLIGCAGIMISRGELFWPPSFATLAAGLICLGWSNASTRAREAEAKLSAHTVNITAPLSPNAVAHIDAVRQLEPSRQRQAYMR